MKTSILSLILLLVLVFGCKKEETTQIKLLPKEIVGENFHYGLDYDENDKMINFYEKDVSKGDTLYKVEFQYNNKGQLIKWNYIKSNEIVKTGVYTNYSDSIELNIYKGTNLTPYKYLYYYDSGKLSAFSLKYQEENNDNWYDGINFEYLWAKNNLSGAKLFFSKDLVSSNLGFTNLVWLWTNEIQFENYGNHELVLALNYILRTSGAFNPFFNTPLYLTTFPSHQFSFIGKNLIEEQKASGPAFSNEAINTWIYSYDLNNYQYPTSVSEVTNFVENGNETIFPGFSYEIKY